MCARYLGPLIREDGSELVNYEHPDFPALLKKNDLKANSGFSSAKSHWHDDVEFISVISGRMKYNINGEIVTMNEGEGVFVNARQFHYLITDNSPCLFYCAVLHPMLLSVSRRVERLYIRPVIDEGDLPYIFLSSDNPWQADILRDVGLMCESISENGSELIVQQMFFRLWKTLCTHADVLPVTSESKNHHLTILKNMISFIHGSYREKISLDDICEAGGVGKTLGTAIFKKCVNCTPMTFLAEYRLKMAVELLQTTDMNVTEIAYETGFSGASYFSESFRKSFGCSPREYRES